MNAKARLLAAIVGNPKQVKFGDACKAATLLGFERKGGVGSHFTYARDRGPLLLNFQNRRGYIPPCQARQLAAMIDKYGDLA